MGRLPSRIEDPKRADANGLKALAFGALVVVGMIAVGAVGFARRKSPSTAGNAASAVQPETVQAAAKLTVGIQAGHWHIDQVPDELNGIRYNGGAEGGGYTEVDTNVAIATAVVKDLEDAGIDAQLLPATVPEGYKADAFVAIHADGNDDTSVSGYKVAPSDFDRSGKAQALSDDIQSSYGTASGMALDPNITLDMTDYYAFNFAKFHASIDPTTPGALVETGFITNSSDRGFIVKQTDLAAQAIADGIVSFLKP